MVDCIDLTDEPADPAPASAPPAQSAPSPAPRLGPTPALNSASSARPPSTAGTPATLLQRKKDSLQLSRLRESRPASLKLVQQAKRRRTELSGPRPRDTRCPLTSIVQLRAERSSAGQRLAPSASASLPTNRTTAAQPAQPSARTGDRPEDPTAPAPARPVPRQKHGPSLPASQKLSLARRTSGPDASNGQAGTVPEPRPQPSSAQQQQQQRQQQRAQAAAPSAPAAQTWTGNVPHADKAQSGSEPTSCPSSEVGLCERRLEALDRLCAWLLLVHGIGTHIAWPCSPLHAAQAVPFPIESSSGPVQAASERDLGFRVSMQAYSYALVPTWHNPRLQQHLDLTSRSSKPGSDPRWCLQEPSRSLIPSTPSPSHHCSPPELPPASTAEQPQQKIPPEVLPVPPVPPVSSSAPLDAAQPPHTFPHEQGQGTSAAAARSSSGSGASTSGERPVLLQRC